MSNTVGERINQLRKKKGISPAELARRIGTDRQRVYNWIKNENRPRQDALEKLAEALDSTPEEIMFGAAKVASTPSRNVVTLIPEQQAAGVDEADQLFAVVASQSLRLPARYKRALIEVLQAVRVLTEGDNAKGGETR